MKKRLGKKPLSNAQQAILGRMQLRDAQMRVGWNHEFRSPAVITGKLAEPVQGSDRLLAEAAIEFLEDNRALFRIREPRQDIQPIRQVRDEAGNYNVALQQYHKGVPVEGGTARVQFDGDRTVTRVANKFVPDLDIDTTPQVTPDQASATALADAVTGELPPDIAPALVIHAYKGEYYLAWHVVIGDLEHAREMHYLIDAHTGAIIHKYNGLTAGQGTGVYSGSGTLTSVADGTQYKLVDNTRSAAGGPVIKTCDMGGTSSIPGDTYVSSDSNDNWNTLTTSPRYDNQGSEVDIHRYMGEVVDYYTNKHSWKSFDNAGSTIYAGVHHKTNYNNAFWNNLYHKFFFGDGDNSVFGYLTARDIVAHEFTHGVTAHTSLLGYPDDQPGALNEGFSDIFAAFVDNDDTDMGEEVTTPATAGDCLRRMNNPADPALGADFRIPNHCVAALDTLGIGYQDTQYDSYGYITQGDPHVNCGPIIYAAYFMLMGGTHPNSHITTQAIGYAKTEKIFWHVQHSGLLANSNATFLECREAALNAVNALYKTDADYLSILDSVKNAFTAVGIGADVFVRDSLADTGVVPTAGVLCESPDIIIRTAKVNSPQAVLGDLTRGDLSDDVEAGQDNWVYVRLQNRGAVNGDVKVTVYWSDVTTFGMPSQWHAIGSAQAYAVAPGGLSIAEIKWPSTQLPPVGHFCLIAELDDVYDPAPDKTLITDGSLYTKFIAESNNYAWKNVTVVDALPAGMVGMEWVIHGHAGEHTDLVIDLRQLPAGTDVRLRLLKRLTQGAQFVNLAFDTTNTRYTTYRAEAHKECVARDLAFQLDDTSTAVVYVHMPDTPGVSYTVSVSETVNGLTVGRVTRVFNVLRQEDFEFIGNHNSLELHKPGCPWLARMSKKNMVGWRALDQAHLAGYDNCAECLGDSHR